MEGLLIPPFKRHSWHINYQASGEQKQRCPARLLFWSEGEQLIGGLTGAAAAEETTLKQFKAPFSSITATSFLTAQVVFMPAFVSYLILFVRVQQQETTWV